MTLEEIDAAVQECIRFLVRAKRARDRVLREPLINGSRYCYSSRETGALKRASLDLSMALADLRRRG